MKNRLNGILVITAVLTFLLAGCGTASKNQAPPPVAAPAAAPAPPPAAPPPPPPPPRFVIEGVHFGFDKAELAPQAQNTLDKVASALKEQPSVRYEIGGHTDSIGTEAYNQGLAERRVNSVRDYLVQKGVAPGQLMTRAYGEMRPIADNNTEDGRAKNRRVEINPVR